MSGPARLRRSQLVTPATASRMIEKAAAIDCDSLVLDLEDAVAPSAKPQARENVRTTLGTLAFGEREVGVRINGLATPWFLDDLLALQGLPLHTVIVPKVDRPEDVAVVATLLRQLEWRGGPTGVTLQILIETAVGLEAAVEIGRASGRVAALIFGAGDFTADTGIAFTPRGLLYARMRVVAAAAAAGVQALDHVHPAVGDLDGLRASAREARELGFSGKWAIHPAQVPVINEVFSPTPDEVRQARRVIEAYAAARAAGQGAITVDGALVDEAMVKAMERRAAAARRLGTWDRAGAAEGAERPAR
jgi:citrate lyase subunit beta/citryl-CoA lyase